jgi:hypothetical protein
MSTIRRYCTLFVASLAVLGGTAAVATRPASDVACEMRASQSSGGLRLKAVATSRDGAAGEYELVIVQSDAGNTSEISQGGEFAANPGEEVILGEATLRAGESASLEAKLKVKVAGKPVCEARLRRSV